MLVALIAISAVSIFLAYTSLQSTETRLQLVATQDLRTQVSEEAGDATTAIGSNFDAIRDRLETAAASPLLQDDDQMRALLDATQAGIQYDGRINYLDRDGIVLYTTDGELVGNVGSDRSGFVYYNEVKERRQPILTGLFKASDNRSSVSVAVPVLGGNGDFDGVLAAILPVDSLISRVSDRLPLIGSDELFIVSTDGTITGHRDESFIGESIFDRFDAAQNDIVDRNLQLMTEGRSGVFEYATQDGQRKIAAYSSLAFSGNIHAWSVLIVTAASQDIFSSVLSDQRIFTIVAIILIVIIAAIFMAFILTLNKRLHRTVQKQDVQIKGQLDDLQDAYERLTEQDKIKDEFINIAAHELRTPVLPIILSAEGLAEDLGTSDNSKVEIILRNAKRINKLTNDILDVSRIKSNTFRLQKERTGVKKLVEEAIQDVIFKMAESKNPNLKVAFESKLPEGKDEIMADRGRLNQVLANLLDNAVNFTDQGMITVTLQEGKDLGFVEVSVADTGKGIDPAIRSRLFEKFVTRSEKARGTGLGLYLCKAIVEAHGGKIWAEDRKDDKGTVFAFTLPAGG